MFRRAALTTLTAVTTTAAVLSLPIPAAEAVVAPPTQGIAFLTDTMLVRADSAAMNQAGLAGFGSSTFAQDLAASGDGSRLVYDQTDDLSPSDTTLTFRDRIQVRDVSGGLVRTADDRTTTINTDTFTLHGSSVGAPVLSPDGGTVVWGVINFDLHASALRRAAVAGGPATTISGGDEFTPVGFANATTLIGTDLDGDLATLPLAGGATTKVTGAPAAIGDASVASDGSEIAYLGGSNVTDLVVAPLTSPGGTWTMGSPTTLTTAMDTDKAPRFSQDGAALYWAQNRNSGDTDLFTIPTAGGTATALTNDSDTAQTEPVGIARDSVAPGAATAQPFTLAGTSATLHWTLPADADASGVQVHRTGGTGGDKTVFAPGTSYVDTGLKVGTTYTYELTTLDRSGNFATSSATRQLTAIAPFATLPDPTSTKYYLSPAFRAYFPTTGTYDVQVRTNGTGALAPWITNGSGGTAVYSAAKAGYSYGLLETVKDGFGNASLPTGVGTAVVPYDQTRAAFSGTFVTQSINDRYFGSATILKTAGSAARLVVNGNRLQIVGERCTSCGVMDVYVDGTRVAGIDTRDTQRRSRYVLYTRNLTAGANHTIVIKARGTAGRPNVVLDGFGVRH